MRRMLIAAAVVLCGSVAIAAPPSVEPELATWWDTWHDAEGRLIFPVERTAGQIIPYSYKPYENNCRRQLRDIILDTTTSPAARAQAIVIQGHWGIWKRGTSPIIDI